MAISEQRYHVLSSLKAIGFFIVPYLLLFATFHDPPDFGTKTVRSRLAASDAKGGGAEPANSGKRYLAAALEDFDRFCVLVDSEATNTVAYDRVLRSSRSYEYWENAGRFAPHLSIDYSWNEELEEALLKMDSVFCRPSMIRNVFAFPEEKEMRLKLEGDKDGLRRIKEEYVRFRVFPFAPDPWTRWCLLTRKERKDVVNGPIFGFAIWLSTVLGTGAFFYFFLVRHWCEKCWRDHWLWRCPYEKESESRKSRKGLLIAAAVYVGMFAFLGWWIVDWDNVAKLSRVLRSGLGESAELFCQATPVLRHSYQLELLEELSGFDLDRNLAMGFIGSKSGSTPDFESDFIRIVALDDIFRATIAPDNQQ